MGNQLQTSLRIAHIENFKRYYAGRLRDGMAGVAWEDAHAVVAAVQRALAGGRRVFAFGNGGSCAIATTFLLDLKASVERPQRRLVAPALQIHEAQGITHAGSFDRLF